MVGSWCVRIGLYSCKRTVTLLLRSVHGSAMAHPRDPLREALMAIPTPTRMPYHQQPHRPCWWYDVVEAPLGPCFRLAAWRCDLCARPCCMRHSQLLVGVEPCMHLHARRCPRCIAQGYTLKVPPLHPGVCPALAGAGGWAAGGVWGAALRHRLRGLRAGPRHRLRLGHHAVAMHSSGENVN